MLAWFDPSNGQLGQVASTPVVVLRRGRRYEIQELAPVPCEDMFPPRVSSGLQEFGAQLGVAEPWNVGGHTQTPAPGGCLIEANAVWDSPDASVNLQLVKMPDGIVIRSIRDETTGAIIYDANLLPQPAPPTQARRRGGGGGLLTAIGVAALVGGAFFLRKRRI